MSRSCIFSRLSATHQDPAELGTGRRRWRRVPVHKPATRPQQHVAFGKFPTTVIILSLIKMTGFWEHPERPKEHTTQVQCTQAPPWPCCMFGRMRAYVLRWWFRSPQQGPRCRSLRYPLVSMRLDREYMLKPQEGCRSYPCLKLYLYPTP